MLDKIDIGELDIPPGLGLSKIPTFLHSFFHSSMDVEAAAPARHPQTLSSTSWRN